MVLKSLTQLLYGVSVYRWESLMVVVFMVRAVCVCGENMVDITIGRLEKEKRLKGWFGISKLYLVVDIIY